MIKQKKLSLKFGVWQTTTSEDPKGSLGEFLWKKFDRALRSPKACRQKEK